MIGRLRGELAEIGQGEVLIDVHGVGYRVVVGNKLAASLTQGLDVTLHISTQVREDAITLFGFKDSQDRAAFRVLIGVPKIGPKLALAVLDHLGLNALAAAVQSDNDTALVAVSGIGRRTAQRLVIDLKDKLPVSFDPNLEEPTTVPGGARVDDKLPLALSRLGYRKSEIDRALKELSARGLGEADLQMRLAESLRILSGGGG